MEHLISTPVARHLCKRCKRDVLVGIAEGLTVRVDPVPVATQLDELNKVLAGMATFDVMRIANRTYLVHRDHDRIVRRKHTVYAQHWCAANGIKSDPAPKKAKAKTPPLKNGALDKPPF